MKCFGEPALLIQLSSSENRISWTFQLFLFRSFHWLFQCNVINAFKEETGVNAKNTLTFLPCVGVLDLAYVNVTF